jgi:excisionase family DNA binding protein
MEKKASSKKNTLRTLQKEILKKLTSIESLLTKNNDKPLTFREACTYLGYAPSYLYKLTYKKLIPYYKPTGKMIFFSKNELDEWIFRGSDECRVTSDELKEEKITERDPNQIEMELQEDVLIEFPLKSRRSK